jgi:hypothetical protein
MAELDTRTIKRQREIRKTRMLKIR